MAVAHFPGDRAAAIENVYRGGTLEVISSKPLPVALAQVSHRCAKASLENPQEPGLIVSLDTMLQCSTLLPARKYFFPMLGKKRYERYTRHTRDCLCQAPHIPGDSRRWGSQDSDPSGMGQRSLWCNCCSGQRTHGRLAAAGFWSCECIWERRAGETSWHYRRKSVVKAIIWLGLKKPLEVPQI